MLNGVFAMSELAIVSARTAPLRTAAQQGNRGAQIALSLGAEPGKFLSTVQIGITLIGIVEPASAGPWASAWPCSAFLRTGRTRRASPR